MDEAAARLLQRLKRSVARERRLEPRVERLSRYVWPWREAWLAGLLGLAVCLDYLSTYAVLEASTSTGFWPAGPWSSEAFVACCCST